MYLTPSMRGECVDTCPCSLGSHVREHAIRNRNGSAVEGKQPAWPQQGGKPAVNPGTSIKLERGRATRELVLVGRGNGFPGNAARLRRER